jgi:K(+)-stimulated pyrophosphate-energized sodium pump
MGAEPLGGFLAGATVSGVLMGIFQNNAGGAWDNAKKSFEKGVEINGEMFYKKSEPHKASVTGDTVGDPFKDTSGPSMNILIKLMSIVSLVLAPTLAKMPINLNSGKNEVKEQKVVFNIKKSMTAGTTSTTTVEYTTDPKLLIEALTKDSILKDKEDVNLDVNNDKITVNGIALTDEQNAKYNTYLIKKK